MAKILLCDGHNLAFRAFYGITELSRSDGFPTNMIHGWLRTFWRLEDYEKPDVVRVYFDKGAPARRVNLLPEYKANRGASPEDFQQQLPWVKQLTVALGYSSEEREGLEADDLIAAAAVTLAEQNQEVLIVSADKDLSQLICPGVRQLLPPPTANPRIGWRTLDVEGVCDKFGVPPERILDYLALIGDTSDNIPGLPGVGPKTAVKWLSEHGTLENVIANAGRLTPKRFCSIVYENQEILRRNIELVRLEHDVEIDLSTPPPPNLQALREILTEMEMPRSIEEAERRYAR
jgi:DNA polymerase-1